MEFDGDVEETYCLNFSIIEDYYGEKREIELIKGGSQIALKNENRKKYVNAYLSYIFHTSIEKQFQFFLKGFFLIYFFFTNLILKKNQDLIRFAIQKVRKKKFDLN